jgi:hypothetical protein
MSSFRDRPLQVDGTAVEVIQALKLEPRIMRYELSEYDWSGVKPMLPNKPRGVPRVNDRRVLNGILWVLRSGRRGAICQRTLDHTLATIASFAGDETKLWKHWPPLTTAR